MRKEQKQVAVFGIQMLVLLAFSILYAIGGSGEFWGGELWIRRWLGVAVLSVGAFLISKDWRYLAVYPLMAGALTLPYGGDLTWEKVGLRALFGLVCAVAYNLVNVLRGYVRLAIFGTVICFWASIYLGVVNPTPNAIIEQGAIAFFVGFTYIVGTVKKT